VHRTTAPNARPAPVAISTEHPTNAKTTKTKQAQAP